MNSSICRASVSLLVAGGLVAIAAGTSGAKLQEPDGAVLYRQHCRSCHGANGVPTARMVAVYPKLKALDSTFLATLPTDSIIAGLRRGYPDMKSYAGKLSDNEMAAVATFVKTLGRASGTP